MFLEHLPEIAFESKIRLQQGRKDHAEPPGRGAFWNFERQINP
jgi:hypothetical protein